ncbi:hypothetical protein ACOMHN_050214 [Nucella lapillus]
MPPPCRHDTFAALDESLREITAKIRALKAELKTRDLPLYNGESWELLIRRWAKLEKDFRLKNGQFEISKIPDIYDCIKYDLQHNQKTLQYDRTNELFMCSKALADIIIPQEYGITVDEKLHIAQNYCSAFLRKIRSDFLQVANPNMEDATTRLDSRYSKGVASPERFVRTRLYFTSESHIHSLLNMLRYGNFFGCGADSQWERALSFLDATAELNYMSQIVFMLFEDPSKDLKSDERYHMELHFSPGAYTSCDEPEPRGMGYRPKHCPQEVCVCQKTEKAEGEKTPHTLMSAFMGPLPPPPGFKRGLRLDTTAAASDLGDISEYDMFEQLSTPGASPESLESLTVMEMSSPDPRKSHARLPGSPDPNIPEWDWGDDSGPTASNAETAATHTAASSTLRAPSSQHATGQDKGGQASDPASILGSEGEVSSSVERRGPEQDSVTAGSSPHISSLPININVSAANNLQMSSKSSLDEKRSRSLEDKNDCPTDSASFHRNYKTVHLPLLHNDIHSRRSLPCVFTMGFLPGAKALEGFSYVPQLHPLETLHNTLTFREMDDFLGRITSTRFPVPAISPTLAASRPSLMLISPSKYPHSYPPSSNSSSGPSSPSSAPTSVDFFLRMCMERSSDEPQCTDSESSLSSLARRRDNQVAGATTITKADDTAGGDSKKPQREDSLAEVLNSPSTTAKHTSMPEFFNTAATTTITTADTPQPCSGSETADCPTGLGCTPDPAAACPKDAHNLLCGEGCGPDRADSGHRQTDCDSTDAATSSDGKVKVAEQGPDQRSRAGNRFAVSRISDDAPHLSPPAPQQKER